MTFYENVFIARQDISTAQVEAMAAQFTDIIKGQGGEVTKTENWGLRNLTYRIKKNKIGLELHRCRQSFLTVIYFFCLKLLELQARTVYGS